MSDHELVRVTWIDAHTVTETWTPIHDLDDDPCVVVSVGHLLTDAKPGHVVIAQSWIAGNDEVDSVLAVPTGMVRRIEKVHMITELRDDIDGDPF